jgi:hypothetical protein
MLFMSSLALSFLVQNKIKKYKVVGNRHTHSLTTREGGQKYITKDFLQLVGGGVYGLETTNTCY